MALRSVPLFLLLLVPALWPVPSRAEAPWLTELLSEMRSSTDAQRVEAVTGPVTQFSSVEAYESLPGGATTVPRRNDASALSHPLATITAKTSLDFALGDELFRRAWVSVPSSTGASDGLGPLFTARSCGSCHAQDGRGFAPSETGLASAIIKVSVPAAEGTVLSELEQFLRVRGEEMTPMRPDPVYGAQLQSRAVPGLRPEFTPKVTWQEREVALAGDESVWLRAPVLDLGTPGYGPLADDARLSLRVAPSLTGLGLLEAVPAAEILTHADPDDRDDDGISGRAQLAWSAEAGRAVLGRFGWKAGMATVREQVAVAFSRDLGLSSSLFPDPWGDCTSDEAECIAAPQGAVDGAPEVDEQILDLVAYYASSLAPPETASPDDAEVLRGKALFHEVGCAACHTPKFVTGRQERDPERSFQLIWPYTDLLLHDMGPGLADGRPEGRADGREWRTPPLWGIGLVGQINPSAGFMHDGRARTLLEAVLWHGGEAEVARDRVTEMSPPERRALVRFLGNL